MTTFTSSNLHQAWMRLKVIYTSADFTTRMWILSHPPEEWRDISYAG
jgi:hypothetical protein